MGTLNYMIGCFTGMGVTVIAFKIKEPSIMVSFAIAIAALGAALSTLATGGK